MSKRRFGLAIPVMVLGILLAFGLAGCGSGTEEGTETPDPGIADGTYVADFTTDSNMFHVNEANEGKGLLTVKDGKMTIHVSLASKKITNLFPGTAEDAAKDGAQLIEPTKDKVVYSDGYEMEVYGFDIPVPALDQEFDVALIGTKGNWYDHKVTVSNPEPGDAVPGSAAASDAKAEDGAEAEAGDENADAESAAGEAKAVDAMEDGEYQVNIAMEGGTGRASIDTPAKMKVEGGKGTLTVTWSSPNYDYMLVDGEKYEPVNGSGNSTFQIPVKNLNEAFKVIADTTAMSKAHEIEYTLVCTLVE